MHVPAPWSSLCMLQLVCALPPCAVMSHACCMPDQAHDVGYLREALRLWHTLTAL